jgi:hypothetical protein
MSRMCDVCGVRPAVGTIRRIRPGQPAETLHLCEIHMAEQRGMRSAFGGLGMFDDFFSRFYSEGAGGAPGGAAGGGGAAGPTGPGNGCQQLDHRALRERLHSEVGEELMGNAELLSRIHAPALTSKPLAIQEVGTREVDCDPGAPESVDRLHEQVLGPRTLGQERARA